jgi:hypothetical protein
VPNDIAKSGALRLGNKTENSERVQRRGSFSRGPGSCTKSHVPLQTHVIVAFEVAAVFRGGGG